MNFITSAYELHRLKELKEAGASAVIIADSFYGARGAFLITAEEFPAYKQECASLGLQCYALVNRFFVEDELEGLRQYLRFLMNLDIDGIYFGDEAVLQIAKQMKMEDKLIYQPDTLLTNAMDAQFYLDERIQMVSLSREITLEEICAIAQKCNGKQLEVVIHGRLNMMHSKRQLISNYLKFIHSEYEVKNKRTLYMMEETRDEHMPIMEDALGTHAFSGFTLASFPEIRQLKEAGIGNVRIEGIFHNADYTIEALRCYQAILQGNADAEKIMQEYCRKYACDNVTSGFYYKKTSRTK